MAGPWEKYKKATPAVSADEERVETPAGKPWLKYQKPVETDKMPVLEEEPVVAEEATEQGMILPISKDAEGNTQFDSDAGLLGAFKRAFMLPGEVMAGEVDPLSPEGIERAFEFAGTVSPAGAASRVAGRSVRQGAALAKQRNGSLAERLLVDRADDPMLAGKRLDDFTAIGAEPTAGMINNSTRTAGREHALAATRQGGEVQKRIEGAFGKMNDTFEETVDGLATRSNPNRIAGSRQELGSALMEQAERVKAAGYDRSRDLYGKVTTKTEGQAVTGTATKGYLDNLATTKKDMGASDKLNIGPVVDNAIKRTKAIVDDVANGKADFNKLKEERTRIGAIIADKAIDPDTRKYLSGLRDALTKDMEGTAREAGPDALQAFRKANNHYRRLQDTEAGFGRRGQIDTLMRKTTPEEVYKYAMAQSKEGGTRLNALARVIDRTEGKEVWDNLAATVVERMGKKADGDMFDATRFAREWGGMSEEAKKVLFRGSERKKYRESLDRIARIADTMKKYNRADNHSNTSKHQTALGEMNPFDKNTILGAALGAYGGGPVGIAAVVAGQAGIKAANAQARRYQANLFASPKTAKWLADVPKAEMAKGGLRAHVGKLRDIARDEAPGSTLAIAISEYLREIGAED